MLIVAGVLVLVGLRVVPTAWGIALAAAACAFELAEKGFWYWATRGIAHAVGAEAMVGRTVTAVSACSPDGRVRFGPESWKARCSEGAAAGDDLVIDAVEHLTLLVSQPSKTNPLKPGQVLS
jgi:membrane protein implicated in regulation of membrane protease activity